MTANSVRFASAVGGGFRHSVGYIRRVAVVMTEITKSNIVYKTCELLVAHFKNLVALNTYGFNSRIFEHMLHPECEFVFAGKSILAQGEAITHPEHVVPCAVMIQECKRMIRENQYSSSEISLLLAKHWKIAIITKEEQKYLDYELGLKSRMPENWSFEEGDSFARLTAANITLIL